MLAVNRRAPSNTHLVSWVDEMARLCKPDRIHWCDGSAAEAALLVEEAVAGGALLPLNREKRPDCYYHRSNPNDVARTEELTFVCTPTKAEA
ncbi:MAG: phosphoenolpyruvate carboxykinase (GTP), partial [Candidatus Limnocylindria bacterium]